MVSSGSVTVIRNVTSWLGWGLAGLTSGRPMVSDWLFGPGLQPNWPHAGSVLLRHGGLVVVVAGVVPTVLGTVVATVVADSGFGAGDGAWVVAVPPPPPPPPPAPPPPPPPAVVVVGAV